MTAAKTIQLTRREALAGGAAFLGAAALAPSALARDGEAAFGKAPEWMTLLATSEKGGRDYVPRVEGALPEEMSGVLYRNGPGLFDRGTDRKSLLLDGDGLLQRLAISGGEAHYRNAFVRTPKFVEEEAANRHLYPTWATRAPGGVFSNLGADKFKSQAGVTVYPFGEKLYAFDEMNPAFEINPETLETLGSEAMGRPGSETRIKAHTKFDPNTGDWIFAGAQYGRNMVLHTLIYDKVGNVKEQHTFESSRQCYFHDFFVSENYVIFLLHPLEISLFGFLGGFRSFTESLNWQGDESNIVAVCPRGGGEAQFFEAPASFMWHSLNAFEKSGQLFLDFTSYAEPDHFIGEDALLYRLMRGEMGRCKEKGLLRRYRIDLAAGTLEETILNDGNHEFAMIDLRAAMTDQQVGYFTSGDIGAIGNTVSRFDYNKGTMTSYRFGDNVHASEVIFAPKPGGAINEGWLLVQCLDGGSSTSFFAILDATHVEDGPLANVWLEHHVPISFHGAWKPA